MRSPSEITELVPNARLVMAATQGPFPMETTYAWEPAGTEATTMTLRNSGEPAGFSRVVAAFMGPAMRRANMKDLRRLKHLMERG